MDELREEVRVVNMLGMHARPASKLVQTALRFGSEIHLQLNSHIVNAKSIMGLLTLAAAQGSRVTVICRGADAQAAMDAIKHLFATGFGEN
jgi:phosphocarrier protein HPr